MIHLFKQFHNVCQTTLVRDEKLESFDKVNGL